MMKLKNIKPALFFSMLFAVGFSYTDPAPNRIADMPAQKMYTIGFVRSLFSEVDLSGAQAALKVWVKEIVKAYHYNEGYNLKAKIYKGIEDIKEQMKHDSLAVLVLSTTDYLDFSDKIEMDPVLVLSNKGDIFEQYYLLVRKDDHFKSIKDLKGANVGFTSGQTQAVSKHWLDVVLAKNNISDKTKFFKKITGLDKETQLILNLFFGHLDACVVSKGAFSLMKELNPQIGGKLISIQNSPNYLYGVICYIRNVISANEKELFYNKVMHIQELNSGKQLLSMIKVDKLEPFKKEYLNSSKELAKEYAGLIKLKKIKADEPDYAINK